MIGTQIQRYKDEGMTYYGMRYTLEYYYIVRKNKIKRIIYEKLCKSFIDCDNWKRSKQITKRWRKTQLQTGKSACKKSEI